MIYFTAQQKTEEKVTNIQRRGLEYASKEFRELFELYKLWFTLYICTGRNKESSDFKVFITRTSSLYILGECKETKYDSIRLHTAICSCEILLCSLCTCSYTLHQTDFSFMSKIITDHESWVSGCDLQSKQEFFLLWESPVLKGNEIRNMFVGLFPWVTLTKQASDQASEEGNKRKMNSCTWQQELAQHWKQSSTNPDQGYIL